MATRCEQIPKYCITEIPHIQRKNRVIWCWTEPEQAAAVWKQLSIYSGLVNAHWSGAKHLAGVQRALDLKELCERSLEELCERSLEGLSRISAKPLAGVKRARSRRTFKITRWRWRRFAGLFIRWSAAPVSVPVSSLGTLPPADCLSLGESVSFRSLGPFTSASSQLSEENTAEVLYGEIMLMKP